MALTGDYAPSPRPYVRKQVETFEQSGGTKAATMRGMPIVVVTTSGAKTGKLRKVPLMRVEHQGEYAAVASLGGSDHHPVWYFNVKANPRVQVQDGPAVYEMEAREVTGDEKSIWWERAVAAFPDYADYQRKTDRQIPVFVLSPVSG
jgi:deazaflavin-dependent oxidoreductase (nitroreductase family)